MKVEFLNSFLHFVKLHYFHKESEVNIGTMELLKIYNISLQSQMRIEELKNMNELCSS